MSTSTDGQICFGIKFEEDCVFPWDDGFDGDQEEWWMSVNDFQNPYKYPFDSQGEYLQDLYYGHPQVQLYLDYKDNWEKENPFPVELVNYCAGEYPIYILAVPSSFISCSRGFPTEFGPHELYVSTDEVQKLTDFCKKYEIEFDEGPKWYLTSYWG